MTDLDHWERRDWFFLACLVTMLCFYALLVVLEPVLPDAEDCHARGQSEDCWRLPPADASAGSLPWALGPGRVP